MASDKFSSLTFVCRGKIVFPVKIPCKSEQESFYQEAAALENSRLCAVDLYCVVVLECNSIHKSKNILHMSCLSEIDTF